MTDNPSVNRSLKDKAFDHIDHALGRPLFPQGETYRNYFATDAHGTLAWSFDQSAFWGKSGQDGTMAYYHVTTSGRQALAIYLAEHDRQHAFEVTFRKHSRIVPALTAAKAKYSYFRDISDALPDLAFVDFAAEARVRRAA